MITVSEAISILELEDPDLILWVVGPKQKSTRLEWIERVDGDEDTAWVELG